MGGGNWKPTWEDQVTGPNPIGALGAESENLIGAVLSRQVTGWEREPLDSTEHHSPAPSDHQQVSLTLGANIVKTFARLNNATMF